MKNIFIISLIAAITFSSCMVNRVTIGDGPVGREQDNGSYEYSRYKQHYFLWGLIGRDDAQVKKPKELEDYQIKMATNFWDGLVTQLTLGIFSMRTVKIFTKETMVDGEQRY